MKMNSSAQKRAEEAAERTLRGIDMKKFWRKVIGRVAQKAEANQMARVRSLGKASSTVLD